MELEGGFAGALGLEVGVEAEGNSGAVLGLWPEGETVASEGQC